jgi:hypothetical protein
MGRQMRMNICLVSEVDNNRKKHKDEREDGRPRCRWRITLNWILKKQDVNVWTEFIMFNVQPNVNMAMNLHVTQKH